MNTSAAALALMALVGSWPLSASPAGAHSLKELEDQLFKREPFVEFVDRPAPGFALRDADGHTASLAGYRGKVVILWFIYASCPDVCPLQSDKIAAVQAKINRTPMRDIIQFVAITTDPVHDTSQVLRGYGQTHGLDSSNWIFLTSGTDQPGATRELARRYGLEFTPDGDGMLMHGVVTQVIDKSGNLRARFHGLEFGETNLILYVNALTNDNH